MKRISNEELMKITDFMASVDDMIHGKFILADIKISKILDIINSSEEMFRYISECMINFDYTKEFGRAEIKNSFNGGEYKCPKEPEKIVALVFCMLHDFSIKKLDFYNFIKTNFGSAGEVGQYQAFVDTLLIPFKNIMSEHFSAENMEKEVAESTVNEQEKTIFEQMGVSVQEIINITENDRKIKHDQKEDMLYILKAIKYALKYEDMKIISALLTAFELTSKKVISIKFLYDELKQDILKFYN